MYHPNSARSITRIEMTNFEMFIYYPLKCKTDPHRPKPLKALKDITLREFNAQTKPKMHVMTPRAGLMQLGYLDESRLQRRLKSVSFVTGTL